MKHKKPAKKVKNSNAKHKHSHTAKSIKHKSAKAVSKHAVKSVNKKSLDIKQVINKANTPIISKSKASNKPHKLRIGIFSFTSCAGCQFEILDLEDELLDIASKTDILHFPMAKASNEEGPFDVVFVEGAVTTKEEAKKIKEIREKTIYLVALGTCASFGGVPSIKDFYTEEQIEMPVYQSTKAVQSIRADGVANYVKVDYFMHGCPPNKYEFLHVVKELILGKIPRQPDFPVCKECRENKNVCMLQLGKPCMGPITNGGCNSVCINSGIACKGCRGPIDDANIDMIVGLYEGMGFTSEDVKRFFVSYAGTSKLFSKFVGQTCQMNEDVMPSQPGKSEDIESIKSKSIDKIKIKKTLKTASKAKSSSKPKAKAKTKVTKHVKTKKRK